jgi:8-oxo-dGTP diphosphatase
VIRVVAALIRQGDRFLICQRPPHKHCGGLWEFVGGKTEPGESLTDALVRECREELGVTVRVGDVFTEVEHIYPDRHIGLTLFCAEIVTGTPVLLEHSDLRWVTPAELDAYPFCPADADILERIRRVYGT